MAHVGRPKTVESSGPGTSAAEILMDDSGRWLNVWMPSLVRGRRAIREEADVAVPCRADDREPPVGWEPGSCGGVVWCEERVEVSGGVAVSRRGPCPVDVECR